MLIRFITRLVFLLKSLLSLSILWAEFGILIYRFLIVALFNFHTLVAVRAVELKGPLYCGHNTWEAELITLTSLHYLSLEKCHFTAELTEKTSAVASGPRPRFNSATSATYPSRSNHSTTVPLSTTASISKKQPVKFSKTSKHIAFHHIHFGLIDCFFDQAIF